MAYISKEKVQAKSVKLKALNKQYGVKASFSGSNTSSLILTVQSGVIDFIDSYCNEIDSDYRLDDKEKQEIVSYVRKNKYLSINNYYIKLNGVALEYIQKAYEIMKEGHYDHSDRGTDYFHCSWFNRIQIGKCGKPYILTSN